MKKAFALASVLLAALLIFPACGTHIAPSDSHLKPVTPNVTPGEGKTYEVRLKEDGKAFIPPSTVKAQWSNGGSIIQSEFDNGGVAKADNLNGEYTVTLNGLPDSYVYNPNIYVASNTDNLTEIEIYKTDIPRGAGSGIGETVYTPYEVLSGGRYRAKFTSASQEIFYVFAPSTEGVYAIESWVDAQANEINPLVDIYNGTIGHRFLAETKDEGSQYSSDYTKNFKFTVTVSQAENTVGNSFAFAVKFDSRTEIEFPVSVVFTVSYVKKPSEGPLEAVGPREPVDPQEDFAARRRQLSAKGLWEPTAGGKTWRYTFEDNHVGSYYYLYNSQVKLNPEDGLYHRWNAKTQTYGEIIYVYIGKDDPRGVLETPSKTGFLDSYVSTWSLRGKNYDDFIKAYGAHTNSDKSYPVTAELKQFLEDYVRAQWLFMDGEGTVELWHHLRGGDRDTWLFNCGYYVN